MRGKLLGVMDAQDHFAALGIARAPWVDAEELKSRFHALSSEQHPDAGGSAEAFAKLNTAWQALREPAGCLRHFLELQHPEALVAASTTQAPAELADLFMEIANLRQTAQKFSGKLAAAASPITKALLEPQRMALRTWLDAVAKGLGSRNTRITAALRDSATTPDQLASSHASLVFLGKWTALLAELRLIL